MVRYRRGQSSEYVDDRRGVRSKGGLAAGGGAAVIIAIVVALLGGGGGGEGGGIDVNDVLGQLGTPAGGG